MSEGKQLSGAGLRGTSAGETALCTVGKTGTGLTYRGYDISLLAERASFEEVAYLLLYGALPTRTQLDQYIQTLRKNRTIPTTVKSVLELIPKSAHPMDVLRTACSMLGNVEPEEHFDQHLEKTNRLIALFPAMLLYWYRFSHEGVRIETQLEDSCTGSYFLHLLYGKSPSPLFAKCMNTSLILYAEHEFNASTFTARVCASTLSDVHSCITGAIGSLRGPLHGGANEAAKEMLERFKDPDDAETHLLQMLANKDKIMGFGHAIYRDNDPRNAIIKMWAKKVAEETQNTRLYDIAERVELVMRREKNLFANADFFHAPAYTTMNIPTSLYTPIFVCARVTGWAAHIAEQRSNNRIIRPSADYVGVESSTWVDIDQR